MTSRLGIRTRLALVYGGAFLGAGAVLVVVMLLLVRSALQPVPAARVLAAEVPTSATGRIEVAGPDVLVGRVEDLFASTLSTLLWQSTLVLGLAAVLAAGLGRLVAARALQPLCAVTATARRVSERGLHERIALQGPDDELKELADTVDGMLARLDGAFAGQRRFVADASHELRTPLAVTRTLLELALTDPDASPDVRRLAVPLLATNERSERLLESLLVLAQADGEVLDRVRVDLAAVVRSAVAAVTDEACERGVDLDADARPGCTVAGDPALLEQLVLNLVQNAVRHGTGRVRVACRRDRADVVLQVENDGPVVAAQDVPGLLEPFRRGSGRTVGSGGHGLGLSVVRAVARGHGGALDLQPRPGGGLRVSYRQAALRS